MGQISDIIDVTGIHKDALDVISDLDSIDKKITIINDRVLSIKVDIQGVESISDLTEVTKEYKKSAEELNAIQKENTKVSENKRR